MNDKPVLPRPVPDAARLEGRLVTLERLDPARHGDGLWDAIGADPLLWQAVPSGPFADRHAFLVWLEERSRRADQVLYTILDRKSARVLGLFLLIAIEPAMGRLEIGVMFGPDLARKTAATEAFLLLARYVFETLAYRRLEWRCNPGNEASVRAALRFGFTLEGVLRQNMWVKGRNWDTALYALLDCDWPSQAARLSAWLAPHNFSSDGRQIKALAAFG